MSKRYRAQTLIALIFGIAFASAARAQELQVTPSSVKLNTQIRVVTSRSAFEGRVLHTGAWLEVATDSVPQRIAASAIDSLWIRKSYKGVGGLIGAVATVTFVSALCAGELDECGVVPNGVILVGVSTGIGYALGSLVSRWRLVFSRAPSR